MNRESLVRLAAVVLVAVTAAAAGAAETKHAVAGTAVPASQVARTLGAKLRAAGRGEVRIERVSFDPFTGDPRAVTGTLSLERPNLASLEFPATGERLTVRSDGGEWLQPQLKQMVRFGAPDAAGAARWWTLLLDPTAPGFTARALPDRRYVLIDTHASSVSDSAWITLAADGLPVRLEVAEGPGERTLYRFRGWRFLPARGRTAFEQKPPRDYQVVQLQ